MARDQQRTNRYLAARIRVAPWRGRGGGRRRLAAARPGDGVGGAVDGGPRARRQRPGGSRQHRRARPGQRAEARVRAAEERRDQDDLRHRRQRRQRAHQRQGARQRPDLQARLPAGPAPRPRRQGHRRRHHRDAESLARARHDLGAAGGQARLRREAGVAHRLRRPQDGRGGAEVQQDRAGRHDEPQPSGRAPGDRVHPQGRDRQGLHGPRPVLQDAPRHRQVSRRPDGGRRDLQAEYRSRTATSRRTTRRTSRRSTTTSGSVRRRSARSIAIASTTTGTGTGTTATATPATRARTSSTSRAGGSTRTSIR